MQFDLASAFWLFLLVPIILWIWRTIAGLLVKMGGAAEPIGKALSAIS